MNRPRATGFVMSVRDRLRAESNRSGRPYAQVLELYAVERFLHRLGRSTHRDRFILKGAQLLRFWLGTDSRPTRDVDLAGPGEFDFEQIRLCLTEILSAEVENDGMDFDLGSLQFQPLRREAQVHGARAKLYAYLGRTRVRFQIDVGFGDRIYPHPEDLEIDNFLDLPMAKVRAYTPYTSVAEKLQAMIQLGYANTRMKDYYDLMALPAALEFDGDVLVESVRQTFAGRAGENPPSNPEGLSPQFAEAQQKRWKMFRNKSGLSEAPDGLATVVERVKRFLLPVLEAINNPETSIRRWPPGGPWLSE